MGKIAVVLETEPDFGGEHQYASLIMECFIKHYEVAAICGSKFWMDWCKDREISYIKYDPGKYTLKNMKRWNKQVLGLKTYYYYFSGIGKFLRKENIGTLVGTRQGTVLPPLPCKVIRPVHDLMHRYRGEFPEVKATYESREILFKNVAKFFGDNI